MTVPRLILRATPALLAALLLAAGAHPPHAAAKQIRYSVTATFDGSHRTFNSAVDPIFGPAWSWTMASTGWVARSTRPFVIRRWTTKPPLYQLNTRVTGGLSHTGAGFSSGRPARPPEYPTALPPTFYWDSWRDPRVSGKVFASGGSPTKIYWEIGPDANLLQEVLRHWSTGEVSATTGYWFAGPKGQTKPVDLAKHFGKPFSVTVTRNGGRQDPGELWTTAQRWTLRFTPLEQPKPDVERWQVDVRGTGRDLWGQQQFSVAGPTQAVRAGVDVDWTSRTTLTLEDDELRSARTELLVTGVRQISEPPGAFDVTPTVVARSPYEPKVTKVGTRRYRLNLFKEESSEWRVDFTVAPTAQAVDVLRSYGLADPERLVSDLRTKPVTVTAGDFAPNGPVVVPLTVRTWPRETDAFDPGAQCVAGGMPVPDCFLTSGGERITVTKLK